MSRPTGRPTGPSDPFDVLGLPGDAAAADVQRAHRRLAKRHHPDLGGDPALMRQVNEAATEALAVIAARSGAAGTPAPPRPRGRPRPSAAPRPEPRRDQRGGLYRALHDPASFTIEALPAEAFEALLVATTWLGEILVDEPPYALETHLYEPEPCWCRLDLVPDAGACTVSLTVARVEVGPPVDVETVDAIRDAWVGTLNELDWGDLDAGRRDPGAGPRDGTSPPPS